MSPTPDLTNDNYAFLQSYIQRESGIALGEDKMYLLKSRLLPIIQQERVRSLDELCDRLRTGPTPALRRSVVEAMTTHETLFFRDPAVYDALRTSIIPAIARSRQATRSMRIWSAACSSGQEPYSLAMLLLEAGYADWNIEILGTDLSTQILERAAAGSYLQIEVNRGLPAPLLVKYFQRAGLGWLVKERSPQIRALHAVRPAQQYALPGRFRPGALPQCADLLRSRNPQEDPWRHPRRAPTGRVLPDGLERNYFQPGRQLRAEHLRSHHRVSGPHATGNQMTAILPNESYRPGISQITEAVFSTMLDLSIVPIDPGPESERYELTAAVYYAGAWQGALLLECSMRTGDGMGIAPDGPSLADCGGGRAG